MKHLIIIGTPRSGKSTLAKMLHKQHGYNILSLDDLVQGFVQNFPELGITEADETKNSPLVTPFVKTYVQIQTEWTYPNLPIVVEGTHISPKDSLKLISFAPERFKIVGIGFPNTTIDEKIKEMRKYDTPTDWSFDQTDDELKKCNSFSIEYSKWLEQQCQELGIEFLDTSATRMPVLEKFISEFV